ncbi:DUF3298 and DUF4163 domain-containing protein [Tumebacillus amylolyticus]|nr:DUF3298 and DUF4163 domain-containing protein [Tumebacillus amylolyticus]
MFYSLNLNVPVISGLKDTAYQQKINAEIQAKANRDKADFIQKAKQQADDLRKRGFPVIPVTLTITHEVKSKPGDDIFSMEVITDAQMGGTSKPDLDFYNIYNGETAHVITLQELFGPGYREKLNREIGKQIDERIAQGIPYFKDQWHGISDTQGFYVQDGEVVIVFDKYAIAAGYVGQPEFKIPWDGVLHEKAKLPQ